jgi:1A family penicillin-binding protein
MFLLWISTFDLPDLDSFEQRKVAQSTKIYDRTGKILLYDVFEGSKRTIVPFTEISRNIKNATVAIEDDQFYNHVGIRPLSFLRAVIANLLTGSYGQGGSTITQQVVKNALLTKEKKISRKLKEWVLALKIEKLMSKDEILGIYLNETSYGGSMYGVEEASKQFFGKSSKDLSMTEAAYLAAIPQATTFFSPYGKNLDKLEERKNLVLKRMLSNDFITKEEYESALQEKVEFLPQNNYGILAPHFVIFVKEILEQKYGQDNIENGGLKVITTLDFDLQEKAEEILKRKALENKEKFNAENVALVAIDPKTGDIRSMVGSRDYFDKEIDGNFNVATAHRQPGSTFKPIVYSQAFVEGYTPETVLFDLETEFSTECDTEGKPINKGTDPNVCYRPGNYDDIFRGPVSLRDALAQSINIPAIKTLYLVGIKDALNLAKNMGITGLSDANQYGLTLVLGGGEVSLLDLTSVYGVFANNGTRVPYQPIERIENNLGEVIFEKKTTNKEVLPVGVAQTISDILSDNEARTPSYGRNSLLNFPNNDVAVKTGTTNDYKDAWTIGYTPYLVVGVWAGNNDNFPMEKKVAGQIVAPIWNEVMKYVVANNSNENFKKPPATDPEIKPILRGVWQGGKTYSIDKITGKKATEYTPIETREEKVITDVHSILYWLNKDDPRGPIPTNPGDDSQFDRWEGPVKAWAEKNGYFGGRTDNEPSTFDDIHTPENKPKINISGLQNNVILKKDDVIKFTVSSQGRYPLSKIVVYINGSYLSTLTNFFTTTINISELNNLQEDNEIKVVGFDSVYNQGENSIIFNVKNN